MYLVGPFLLNVISSLSLCPTVNLPRLSHNITYVYSSWHASMQINFTTGSFLSLSSAVECLQLLL